MNLVIVEGTYAYLYDRPEPFVEGQKDFVKMAFQFDEAWDGSVKEVQFENNGALYSVGVLPEDGILIVPYGLTVGECAVRIKGTFTNGSVIATANEIFIPVVQGYEDGGVSPPDPRPPTNVCPYNVQFATVEETEALLDEVFGPQVKE